MRSLLVIASHFPPKNSAGVYRTLRFVKYLPAHGWSVHVLTLLPECFESGSSLDERLLQQVPESVRVHRTRAIYPLEWAGALKGLARKQGGRRRVPRGLESHGQTAQPPSWYQRLKDAVSLPLMTPDRSVGWLPFAVAAGRRILRENDIALLYSSGPPWTNHLVAYRLKRFSGKPWVADFRDPWVSSDFKPFRRGDGWAGRTHQRLERLVVRNADRLIANTPRSRDDFLRRYGEELEDVGQKLVVIPNGFDPTDYTGMPSASSRASGARLVMAHAGSFYGKRNVGKLIEAVGRLFHNGTLVAGDFELRLIGALRDGRCEEQRQIENAGLQDVVKLLPRVPHDECIRLLAQADVLLLVQVGAPLSVPGKLFEYLALGKPMLVLTSGGATADLVERERLGLCADPDDTEHIAQTLLKCYAQFAGGQTRPAVPLEVRRRYDGRELTGQLDAVLWDVLERRSQP